jgi:3-oxoacyl-(acyl-carrier-protein) synthase
MFLQKARDAKRVYARLVHAKTNSDGFKEEGITYPSREMQKQLMEEFYEECGVNPTSLDLIEAHGTGTKVSLLMVKKCFLQEILKSQDSSVRKVSDYGLYDRSSIPGSGKGFFF